MFFVILEGVEVPGEIGVGANSYSGFLASLSRAGEATAEILSLSDMILLCVPCMCRYLGFFRKIFYASIKNYFDFC